jgi:hypothetical protein
MPERYWATDVVALAHALRRIVAFPEGLEQRVVGNLFRIIDHQHHLVVTGAARADFLIGRIGRHPAGIADGGDMDAIAQFPEFALGAPEAPEAEHRLFEAVRIRPLQCAMIDEVCGGGADRGGAAGSASPGLGMATFLKPNMLGSPAIVACNICRVKPARKCPEGDQRRSGTITSWPAALRTVFRASLLIVSYGRA